MIRSWYQKDDVTSASESRSVQRSLSWKRQRQAERYDRKSARRRTVLPVVRLAYVTDKPQTATDVTSCDISASAAAEGGNVEESTEDAGVKVIRLGSERVEIVQGKVKKHQKGIKMLAKPIQGYIYVC